MDNMPAGSLLRVEVAGTPICLPGIDEQVYAIADVCSHEEASLSEGNLVSRSAAAEIHLQGPPAAGRITVPAGALPGMTEEPLL